MSQEQLAWLQAWIQKDLDEAVRKNPGDPRAALERERETQLRIVGHAPDLAAFVEEQVRARLDALPAPARPSSAMATRFQDQPPDYQAAETLATVPDSMVSVKDELGGLIRSGASLDQVRARADQFLKEFYADADRVQAISGITAAGLSDLVKARMLFRDQVANYIEKSFPGVVA